MSFLASGGAPPLLKPTSVAPMSQFDEWPSRSGVDERAQNVKVVVDDTSLATVVSRIKAWEFVLLRPFLAVASVMMVWLFVGAVVFLNTLQDPCTEIERRNATHLWNEEQCHSVTYAMALYYSVQCGFSVGFGLLVEEANGARWYTIFHGFCGLTIMAAGMTLFLLRPGGRLGKYVAGEDDDEDADGDGIPDRLEGPLLARWARMFFRRLMLEMPFVLLALTFTSAVVFQSIYHGWSFTTSCYFAFFALSTGGLQGPGGTSDAEMLFTAFFLLIGIPLFGAAMSRVVDWLLDKYVRAVRSSERLLSRQKRPFVRQSRRCLSPGRTRTRGTHTASHFGPCGFSGKSTCSRRSSSSSRRASTA